MIRRNIVRMMTLPLVIAGIAAAADFWVSKPYTEWSEREAQKLVASSPWAREITVMPGSFSGHSGDRRGSPDDNPTMMRGTDARPNPDGSNTARLNQPSDEERQPGSSPVKLQVQWRSALPVRQALARMKFGDEVAKSSEAREFIETAPPGYVIAVLGIPRTFLRDGDALKKALVERTTLSSGAKRAIHPGDIQFRAGQTVDVFFVFPKTDPITAEEKEVEFALKMDSLTVKERFRLRDMIFQGKLEL